MLLWRDRDGQLHRATSVSVTPSCVSCESTLSWPGMLATVAGGYTSVASGIAAVVGGGLANTAGGTGACVAGGLDNKAIGKGAGVLSGENNTAEASFASIASGQRNRATVDGNFSSIGGSKADSSHGVMLTAHVSIGPVLCSSFAVLSTRGLNE